MLGAHIRTEARTAVRQMRNSNTPLGGGFGSGSTALETAYAAAATCDAGGAAAFIAATLGTTAPASGALDKRMGKLEKGIKKAEGAVAYIEKKVAAQPQQAKPQKKKEAPARAPAPAPAPAHPPGLAPPSPPVLRGWRATARASPSWRRPWSVTAA